ncbi:MAG TPA: class I SAM-dependent methyltransferase [Bacteroidales bacterium]|nr:class I SAM-dependent methyltransferase [Bacteroidales bacterium]
MINCANCNQELIKTDKYYFCAQCGYKAFIKDKMVLFNPEIKKDCDDFDSGILDALYKYENKHFWFLHRKKIINKILTRYTKKNEKIIEIGAGTGNITGMFLSKGYKNVSIGEMHVNGLKYAKTYGISNLYQFDLLKTPFTEHFDIVCLFDVIEHIENDDLAIKKASGMLKKRGKIIITVPLHQWLWNNIDYNSGHKRRYTAQAIKNLLEGADLTLIHSSYFFSLILPLLFLRKLLNRKQYKMEDNEKLSQQVGLTINPFANFILDVICKIEFGLLKLFTFKTGGSLIVVGEKNYNSIEK